MAHTDRDIQRWMRFNHMDKPCPCDDANIAYWRRRIMYCEICDSLWSGQNRPRYYTGTDGKSAWNRDERRNERGRAKTAIRQCRDWDTLSIKYRRPYWD